MSGDNIMYTIIGILFVIGTICEICSSTDPTAAAANQARQIPITNAAAPQVQNNARQIPITNAAPAAAPRAQNNSTVTIVVHPAPPPPPPPPPPPRHGNLRCLVYDTYYRKESSNGGGECAICLDGFDDGVARATTEACKHRFHAFCIEVWLKEQASCPICRHPLHRT